MTQAPQKRRSSDVPTQGSILLDGTSFWYQLRLLRTSICAIALLGASPLASAFKIAYTVGNVGTCDFSNLSDAVAAAALNPPHNIFVSADATAQAIRIENQDLSITGGFLNCIDMESPSGKSTLSGAGNGGQDSVIFIFGTSNVTLSNLAITGGSLPSTKTGGGISFQGNGSLTIADSSVFNNSAGNGGGINANATGGALTLTIGENTFITGNTAQDSGGGIRVEGGTRLFMLADGIFVAQNHALNGDGGGVQVIGPSRADIGSPWCRRGRSDQRQRCRHGGGISVDDSTGQDSAVRLFSTDATRIVRISANAASANGGGIFLRSNSNSDVSEATVAVCAHNFRDR